MPMSTSIVNPPVGEPHFARVTLVRHPAQYHKQQLPRRGARFQSTSNNRTEITITRRYQGLKRHFEVMQSHNNPGVAHES